MRVYRQHVLKDGEITTVKKWYADVHLPSGKRVRLPLFESERLSREFAGKLDDLVNSVSAGRSPDKVTEAWLSQLPSTMLSKFIKMGLVDSVHVEGSKALTGHLDDYKSYLVHKGDTPTYAGKSVSRIESILTACKFKKIDDIQPSKIQKYLSDEMQAERMGQRTANHYIRAIKCFVNWMNQDNRTDKNPVRNLKALTVTQILKDRRALSIEEISYLLGWLETKATTRRSLTGWERAVLYRLALTTGLRADEIRHLTASSIDFKGKSIHLSSSYTKNRREAILPLREDVLADLQTLIKTKTPDAPLFRHVTDKTAKLIRADMEDARAYWIEQAQTPDEKKHRGKDDFLKVDTADGEIDFHALRHSFGSMLASGGVHPSIAQKLMRHSTITLTMNRYTHVYRESDAAAVDSLPAFGKVEKMEKVKKA